MQTESMARAASKRPVSIPAAVPAGLVIAFLLSLLPVGVAAQEADPAQWRNTTELSFLMSGGNASASTAGLRNMLRRRQDGSELRLDVSGMRTDAVRVRRFAVGTGPDDFRVEEERDRERTAERYAVEGRYDRDVRDHAFAFAGAGWTRNTFAGFNHRTVAFSGAGARWDRDGDWELKLGLALTYTVQRDVTPDPDRADSFAGLRFTLDHARALTESTELELKWMVDGNAREPSDVRGDLVQALAVTLTERLALKTTLQLNVDNDPPLQELPLWLPDGTDTDTTVLVPLQKLDHSLSLALVITL